MVSGTCKKDSGLKITGNMLSGTCKEVLASLIAIHGKVLQESYILVSVVVIGSTWA